MSRLFLTPVDLGQNEIQNGVIQNLAAAPTSPAPKRGQLYMNTTNNTLFWFDGSGWISAVGGAGAFPGYGASVAVTTFGQAKADGAGTTVARADHTHGSPAHDAAAHSAIPLSSLAAATAAIALGGFKITGLADGTAATDAATKQQLDTAIQGLDAKQSVRLASTANLGLTGLAAIDGVTPVANDRILAKNQTTTSQNGIYTAAAGAWTRATDMDTWAEVPDAFTWVEQGSLNADTGWVCTTVAGGTIGTNPITWTQFSGAGQISAGAGMTKTGSQLDVGEGAGLNVLTDSIEVEWGGTGAATTVARSDHTHAATGIAKYSVDVGGSTSQVITHNLNTRDVQVNVYRNSTPWDTVECDVERTSTTTCTLRFATAPGAAAFRAVVAG